MRDRHTTRRRGFTLIELMVVMGMIVVIIGMTLPSMISIFSAGADSQAHNHLTAQLMSARALAIQNATYAAVHVQMADPQYNPKLAGDCYTAVMVYNPVNGTFELPDGYAPRRIGGRMAFGGITDNFIQVTGNNVDTYRNLDTNLDDFTCFTIVFSPTGSIVTQVDGQDVVFTNDVNLFVQPPSYVLEEEGQERRWLWNLDHANDADDFEGDSQIGRPGVTSVTLFPYRELQSVVPTERDDYLNRNGQFLPINVHTGQVFRRR